MTGFFPIQFDSQSSSHTGIVIITMAKRSAYLMWFVASVARGDLLPSPFPILPLAQVSYNPYPVPIEPDESREHSSQINLEPREPTSEERIDQLSSILLSIPLYYECATKEDFEGIPRREQVLAKEMAGELALIPGHSRQQIRAIRQAIDQCLTAETAEERISASKNLNGALTRIPHVLARLPTVETLRTMRDIISMFSALERMQRKYRHEPHTPVSYLISMTMFRLLTQENGKYAPKYPGDTWLSHWMKMLDEESSMTRRENYIFFKCVLLKGRNAGYLESGEAEWSEEDEQLYQRVHSLFPENPGYPD